MTTVCVFPGQGSQKKGMGAELFSRFPRQVEIADEVMGWSIAELCLEDPDQRLGQTQYTQPALFVVNALSFLAREEDGGRAPDLVAGHSLGEYDALFAAGAFDFATGLGIVKRRGELMAAAAGGGMAAVVGLGVERVAEILKEAGADDVDMANLNAPTQVVLSGPLDSIRACRTAFEQAGCRLFRELDVSAPFHSRYMTEAREGLEELLRSIETSPLAVPVISNVTARPYADDAVADLLAEQVTAPVRWTESIEYLLDLGGEETEFEEIGPGKVLTGLIRQIKKAREG